LRIGTRGWIAAQMTAFGRGGVGSRKRMPWKIRDVELMQGIRIHHDPRQRAAAGGFDGSFR
jgi:hypothetical protein